MQNVSIMKKYAIIAMTGFLLMALKKIFFLIENWEKIITSMNTDNWFNVIVLYFLFIIECLCFASYFALMLKDKPTKDILGALGGLIMIIYEVYCYAPIFINHLEFSYCFSNIKFWFYFITYICSSILLFLYFCNVNSDRISPKCNTYLGMIGVLLPFIGLLVNLLSISYDGLINLSVSIIAQGMVLVFFIAEARRIKKQEIA